MQAPGEGLLIKLFEQLSSGLGTLARPWIIKREARANPQAEVEAYRIKREELEAIRRELRNLRSGQCALSADDRSNSQIKITNPTLANQIEEGRRVYIEALRASEADPSRLIEIEREINLAQVAVLAYEEAATDSDGANDDEPLDPDWFAKWRNYAQDVSKEEMQRLWARVLKQEVKSANSFTLHTMDFLSRMSRSDAELISTLGEFVLENRYVYAGSKEVLEGAGIDLDKLLYLSDLGILIQVTGLNMLQATINFSNRTSEGDICGILSSYNKAIVMVPKDLDPENVGISIYPLSIIGQELMQLASCAPNIEYLKEIASEIGGKCHKLGIGDIEKNADQIRVISNIEWISTGKRVGD